MTDEKELGKAIKEEKDEIVIEGDLVKKIIRIRATGKVAWATCAAALTIAVVAIIAIPTTGGTAAPMSCFAATPALAGTTVVLGVKATTVAITIAVAAGGGGALNKLREYDMEKISDTKAILRKKKE